MLLVAQIGNVNAALQTGLDEVFVLPEEEETSQMCSSKVHANPRIASNHMLETG